jgi:hypothetical protein
MPTNASAGTTAMMSTSTFVNPANQRRCRANIPPCRTMEIECVAAEGGYQKGWATRREQTLKVT